MGDGTWGERYAEAHLMGLGLVVLARNHRTRSGEVDLVMLDSSTLVFVEVRTRTDPTRGSAAETIDGRKRSRIVSAARDYLLKVGWLGAVRFDVVGITGAGDDKVLEYIVDAFGVET